MTDNNIDFATHRRIWENNARQNAKWAVISDPRKIGSEWNDEEFFASGEGDVARTLDTLARLGIDIKAHDAALDFGCGVGRLTRALSARFRSVVGIDVSGSMIEQARAANSDRANCEFVANSAPDLRVLHGRKFNLILSLLVIQHIPPQYSEAYIKDLLSLLASDGALVVQIPSHRTATLRNKLRSMVPERLFRLKHALLRPDLPYITMYGIREGRVRELANASGVALVEAKADGLGGDDWISVTYCFQRKMH